MPEIAVPVPAATILLLRDGDGGLEVLMTKRHDNAYFAGGALVFPGGKVDAADAGLARNGWAARGPDAGFWIAGIRETFEECGMLLARRAGSDRLLTKAELGAVVARHGGGEHGWAQLVAAGEHELATDLLVHFAHWITPADRPKRYDTHFFLAPAPEDQDAVADGRETTELAWISPARALAEADAGRVNLVFATRLNLVKLARTASVETALAAARRERIVTVCPELVQKPEGPVFRIPEEAGYGLVETPVGKTPRA